MGIAEVEQPGVTVARVTVENDVWKTICGKPCVENNVDTLTL